MAVPIRPVEQPLAIDVLPRSRNSKIDLHHLAFPLSDMRQAGLATFSTLGCSKAPGVDSLTHTIIHQLYLGIMVLSSGEALRSIRRAGSHQTARHEDRRCSCYNPELYRAIDPFTLEAVDPKEIFLPPCTVLVVDESFHDIMTRFYTSRASLADGLRHQLHARCTAGDCGCYRQRGGETHYLPTVFQDRLRIPA